MMQRILTGLTLGVAAALLVAPAVAIERCTGSCSILDVLDDTDGTPTLSIDFTQAPNDGQGERGNDEIAALAFTVGIPGTGTATPLQLANCADANGDGLPDAAQPGSAIASGFKLVIENWQCTNRNRCLCPGEGQSRDNFINIAVYGPKDLPAEGAPVIPVLPSGRLVDIALQATAGTVEQNVTAHIFSELDDPLSLPKPQFGAFVSQGDKSAVDETADRGADRLKIDPRDGIVRVVPATCACLGDCNRNGSVTVDELVKGVNIALGSADLDTCPCFDGNSDRQVAINELVGAVNSALNGCPQ